MLAAVFLACHSESMSSEITTSRNQRYLLWHSPSPDFLVQFERTWKQEAEACKDRDLVILQIKHDTDRIAYKIPKEATAILLIGKDGGIKARWARPVAPKEVYSLIDAMPMRQQELLKR